VPRTNPGRRRDAADAAIALLAESGVHGLTHRAVEKAAGLPPGTASNYFRTREALLIAAAERVKELHFADMDRAAHMHNNAVSTTPGATSPTMAEQLVDLLAGSLLAAATTLRARYLAVIELQLEARRHPALASSLAALLDTSISFTAGHHAQLNLPIPADRIPTLITLYYGALFTLVTAPPETINENIVNGIAHAIVHGALPDWE
jgi:AcrR family transcriptional regulator